MRSNPDIDELVRRAEESGGKVLRMIRPGAGPAPMTSDRSCDAIGSAPRPNKYGARRTEYAGLRYDSKAEADYAATLDLEARVCPGMWWVRQVVFHLGCPENTYRVDFLVYSPESPTPIRAVDVKGRATAKFLHDVVLWRRYAPCPLEIVSRKRGAFTSEFVRGRNPNP